MIIERNDVAQHRESFAWSDFFPQFLSSTFENWQSKTLQRLWQATELACLFGVAPSRDSDERLGAKIDRLLFQYGIDPAHFDYEHEAGVQD